VAIEKALEQLAEGARLKGVKALGGRIEAGFSLPHYGARVTIRGRGKLGFAPREWLR
jgi:hypothetical protein